MRVLSNNFQRKISAGRSRKVLSALPGKLVKAFPTFSTFSALSLTVFCTAAYADYSSHPKAAKVIDALVDGHSFTRAEVEAVLRKAEPDQKILDGMANAAEKTKTWTAYRKSFLNEWRIEKGVEFMQAHAELLSDAERRFGVPPHIVTAILGVETNYGGYTGKANVLNALATLAFEHPRRGKFFTSELTEFILLAREKDWQVDAVAGSRAGAMGMSQFMPSNYRRLAVDGNGDGAVDLFDAADAIASVAHYFEHHGWQAGDSVTAQLRHQDSAKLTLKTKGIKPDTTWGALKQQGFELDSSELASKLGLSDETPARVIRFNDSDGDEMWLGLQNFYVISRYNPRTKYAMAVYLLSQELQLASAQ